MKGVKPLRILQLFILARRQTLGLCWADVAEQSGATPDAVRRAERRWWVTNSKDLFALLDWTGLRGHPVGLALVSGLNERLKR